jgi:hypothetical protein
MPAALPVFDDLKQKKREPFSHYVTIFIGLISFFFSTATAHAYDVFLSWEPSTDPGVADYSIYGKEDSLGPPYDSIDTYSLDDIDPDNPAGWITSLEDSTEYHFVVNAFDSEGKEGDFSNEVCVSEGVGCAALAGGTTGIVTTTNTGSGGSGGCLIPAAAKESRLAVDPSPVLLLLGAFFIGIEILKKYMQWAEDRKGKPQRL